jgi:hypothetical protein
MATREVGEVSLYADTGHRVSIARFILDSDDDPLYEVEGTGEAVRMFSDHEQPLAGELLAIGRALQHAGRQLERRGEGLVKHQDDVRTAKAAAKEERSRKEARERRKATAKRRPRKKAA